MNKHDYAGYFALAMLEAGIEPAKVKQIVALAQIKMDDLNPDEAWQEAIKQMKSRK